MNCETIALLGGLREVENEDFRDFLSGMNSDDLDSRVFDLNEKISSLVDCTACGACCKSLMINVTNEDAGRLAAHLQMQVQTFEENYIEKSMEGQMIMRSMPCNFLTDRSCSVYEKRFEECRQFPHLHKKNFKGRLFGTLMHYSMCPIVFNVIEALKLETGFIT